MSETPKFKSFLTSKKIDPRRVLVASYRIERLTRDDRAIKRAKGTKVEGADAAAKETRKPHSGRPVTPRSLDAALNGKSVSGPTKQRILRAVNAVLEAKETREGRPEDAVLVFAARFSGRLRIARLSTFSVSDDAAQHEPRVVNDMSGLFAPKIGPFARGQRTWGACSSSRSLLELGSSPSTCTNTRTAEHINRASLNSAGVTSNESWLWESLLSNRRLRQTSW